ncbi:MAG: PilW family protein [Zoogloeaceae bacterium]|jgi:type IV pilus assembly protein PilW|nr:PilW family protein [Zoogloeaceae bacterium]
MNSVADSMRYAGARGFSLVELMVSSAIGLIVLVGVTYAYLGNRETYVLNEEMARMHESARVAMDSMGRDLRVASFIGCKPRPEAVQNRSGVNLDVKSWVAEGIRVRAAGAVAGLDGKKPQLQVFGSMGGVAQVNAAEFSTNADEIRVSGGVTAHRLEEHFAGASSRLAVISDCDKAYVFKPDAVSIPADRTQTGTIKTTFSAAPGEGTIGEGVFGRGAQVFALPVNTAGAPLNIYDMRDSGRKDLLGNAIYSLFHNGAELIEGVEAFRVCVGGDGISGAHGLKPWHEVAAEEWKKAEVVQIDLVLRSIRPRVLPEKVAPRITLCGDALPLEITADRRLRRLFSTSVALRNKLGEVTRAEDEK